MPKFISLKWMTPDSDPCDITIKTSTIKYIIDLVFCRKIVMDDETTFTVENSMEYINDMLGTNQ